MVPVDIFFVCCVDVGSVKESTHVHSIVQSENTSMHEKECPCSSFFKFSAGVVFSVYYPVAMFDYLLITRTKLLCSVAMPPSSFLPDNGNEKKKCVCVTTVLF